MLKEVFKEFVPTCEVVLFGSSANGLGCKGSDLDITLLVDPNIEHWNIDLDELTAANKNTDQKASSASKDIHSFVVKVLRNVVPGCANVIPIFTAKCPVIKFIHQTTSISCDLTVNNRLVLILLLYQLSMKNASSWHFGEIRNKGMGWTLRRKEHFDMMQSI